MALKERIRNTIKAIGAGWRTVGTVMPQGDSFLHFISIASEEDNPKYIRIKNPYLDNSWVYSATRVMAENLAQVPFLLKLGDDEIKDTSIKYGWIRRLFDYVSPYMNKYSLLESIPTWLTLRGECFWKLVRSNINRQIAKIRVLIPDNLEAIVANGDIIGWDEWTEKGQKIHHDPLDIIQFKYYNPYDRFRGLSPLTAASLGLNIDYAASAYNYYFFNNDASAAGLLSVDEDLQPKEADEIETQWNKKRRGLTKKGRIAVLGRGAKYQSIALAQKDIQYLQQKKWSRAEVFAVLGVSPALSGVLEDASIKSNVKEQKKGLYENNLIPKMHFIEEVLKTEFFQREKVKEINGKFDIDSIAALKEDFKDKLDQAEKLSKLGYTRNEINEKLELGFDDTDWGNYWWINFSMVPAGQEPEPAPAPDKRVAVGVLEKAPHPNKKLVWKGLIRQTERIEKDYGKDLADYFYKMRQEVLDKILNHKSVKAIDQAVLELLMFDIAAYNKILGELSQPYLVAAFEVGIDSLKDALETTFDFTNVRAQLSLTKRIKAIQGINETVREQLLNDFAPVLERGLREGTAYEEIAGELADIARNKFNMAKSRARTIARTEINGAMNQARQDTMIESGIKKQEWVTSLDAIVRPSHALIDGQIRGLDELFDNGLLYPHDPAGDAAEVVNCRCVTIPYIE